MFIKSIIGKTLTDKVLDDAISDFKGRKSPVFHFINKQEKVVAPEIENFKKTVAEFIKINIDILHSLKNHLQKFAIKEKEIFDITT